MKGQKKIKISLILQYSVIFLFMMYGSQVINYLYNIDSRLLLAIINGLLAGLTVYLIRRLNLFNTKEVPILIGLLFFIGLPIMSLLIDF